VVTKSQETIGIEGYSIGPSSKPWWILIVRDARVFWFSVTEIFSCLCLERLSAAICREGRAVVIVAGGLVTSFAVVFELWPLLLSKVIKLI